MTQALQLDDLRVRFADGSMPVDGISLRVEPGRCLVLLGESGCGKSLTALALMRLLPEAAQIVSGSAELGGVDLFALSERAMQQRRGGEVAMVFQEPMTSLNPVLPLAEQIGEALRAHAQPAGKAACAALLEAVGLPPERTSAYPFQLSGGQRQRALIAMMLAGDPQILIADEPTTALDVTVQAQILVLLKRLQQERGMGLLLITHDIEVAREMADTIAIAYAGQIVEAGAAGDVFADSRHPYTRALLQVQPGLGERGKRLRAIPGGVPRPDHWPVGCRFAERCTEAQALCRAQMPVPAAAELHLCRCHFPYLERRDETLAESRPHRVSGEAEVILEARDITVRFPIRRGVLRRTVGHVTAVDGVSLQIRAGETLALVGESGCGKTTLARTLLQLQIPSEGGVSLFGRPINSRNTADLRRLRCAVQIVFQDPYSSLNPRLSIGEILEEGILSLRPQISGTARREQIVTLLEQVGLEATALRRYPHAFSGGQRQRIAIARALAVEPKLLICDEPTSALDVSVQAQILNLLKSLQQSRGLACLLISHNLPVVGYLADRVAVMQKGKIVESGLAEQILTAPQHSYTRALLEAMPRRKNLIGV